MAKQKNVIYYGKPANRSFESFKKFIRGMSEKLGVPKERQSSDEKLKASWRKYWAKVDSKK